MNLFSHSASDKGKMEALWSFSVPHDKTKDVHVAYWVEINTATLWFSLKIILLSKLLLEVKGCFEYLAWKFQERKKILK